MKVTDTLTREIVLDHLAPQSELFDIETTSDYAGAQITLRVYEMTTHSRQGETPSTVKMRGFKLRKNGTETSVWTERTFRVSNADDRQALIHLPYKIREALGF